MTLEQKIASIPLQYHGYAKPETINALINLFTEEAAK